MNVGRPLLVGAIAAAASAAVVLACSNDDPREGNRFPTNGGASSGGASASSGGASTSSGGSSSGTASDGGDASDDAATGDAGSCAPLPAQIEMTSIEVEPTETGGTVVDGTFALTKAEVQQDQADGGPI